MIRTWWKDGAWGGVPVRRLGHVVADVINAVEQARVPYTRQLGVSITREYPLQGDDALVTPEWQGPGGGELELPATAVQFDGCAVADPCLLHNFREALRFLEGITEVDPAGHTAADLYVYYAAGATSPAVPTKAGLGIDGLTVDSLTRPQQVLPWAVLREALKRLRYLRFVAITTMDPGVGVQMKPVSSYSLGEAAGYGPSGDSSSAAALSVCNAAIGNGITYQETGGAGETAILTDKVSAAATWDFGLNKWRAMADTVCLESVTLSFRVPEGDGDGLPDLSVTRAEIRFANSSTEINERVSSAGVTVDGDADTITDGKEISWNGPKEEVVVAFTGTRTSALGSVVANDLGTGYDGSKGFSFIVDRVGVNYDLDAVEE